MNSIFFNVTTLSVVAVLIVLVAGLWNMARGNNPVMSQKLMRWRVGLQFGAVIVIMLTFFVAHHA